MNKFTKVAALLTVASFVAACGGHNSALPTQSNPVNSTGQSVTRSNAPGTIAQAHHWIPYYKTFPLRTVDLAQLERQAAASQTIPFYTNSVKSPLDGNTYTFQIVGAAPRKNPHGTTFISYVPIVARVHFPDGTVLDPTQPGCGDTVSVQNRFFKGPNFVATPLVSNGINVGTVQINDAFQRAEFWKIHGTKWHTILKAAASPVVVDVNAPSGSITQPGVCSGQSHNIGEIDFGAWDNIVRGLIATYATPTQVPLVLSYNVFETSGGQCCIIGYHNAYGVSGGTQVYAISAYNDAGIFGVPIEDIHAWTHEIGELFNDPFIDNATPAWGHVGQVSGCQNNLEVGDPLTGTPFIVNFNGFTYHPQELAFFDWFFRTPSKGTGGLYSFEGTFKSAQGLCT